MDYNVLTGRPTPLPAKKDLTKQMRDHVASYKSLSLHRRNCLALCDLVDELEAENKRLRFIESDHQTLKHKARFQAKTMVTLGRRITDLVTILELTYDVVVQLPEGSMGVVPETNDRNSFDIRDMMLAKITGVLQE